MFKYNLIEMLSLSIFLIERTKLLGIQMLREKMICYVMICYSFSILFSKTSFRSVYQRYRFSFRLYSSTATYDIRDWCKTLHENLEALHFRRNKESK